MKRILALATLLLTLASTLPGRAQEVERLAYHAEAVVPTLEDWQLYNRAERWAKEAREPFNFLLVGRSEPGVLDCEVWFQDFQPGGLHTYDILFHVYVICTDGRYAVELTDVVARVDGNALSKYDYLTVDASGIRGGLYAPYWRRHDRKVRKWLEEYFQEVSDSLFEVMKV